MPNEQRQSAQKTSAAPVRSRAIVKSPMIRYRIPTKARKRYVASKRTEGSPSDDAADFARGGQDDERVREGLARELLFRAGERSRGLAVGEDDPVARGKARARRRAVGIDRPQDEGAAVAVRREPGGREGLDLAGKRDEPERDRSEGQRDERHDHQSLGHEVHRR